MIRRTEDNVKPDQRYVRNWQATHDGGDPACEHESRIQFRENPPDIVFKCVKCGRERSMAGELLNP